MTELTHTNPILGEVDRAESVADLKELTSKLSPLQEYARQAGQSFEQINDLAEGRVMAMCKGGYILRGMGRSRLAGRPAENSPKPSDILSPYKSAMTEAGLGQDLPSAGKSCRGRGSQKTW